MNDELSPLLLVGIGTAGASIARGVRHAFGDGIRYVLADTDSSTGLAGEPFTLLGGDRLSGHGAGGDIVAGRLAAEDSAKLLDDHIKGVRIAVIVTALGGGTGGGATLEAAKHLSERGIPSVVFATTPFTFEGEDRQRNARGVMTMIEEQANATFFLPLDKLIGDTDNMDAALRRAVDTVASGVTLFWRLIEKPGYIRLDAERIRHLLSSAGRGRFAVVTVQGPNRATDAVETLLHSPLLSDGSGPARSILCGILGGEDLRLSELGTISEGIRNAFATPGCNFELSVLALTAEVVFVVLDPPFEAISAFIIFCAFAAVCWLAFVLGPIFSISSFTFVVPDPIIPSLIAAALERSISLPITKGPLSFTRTFTVFPFLRFVTLITVLNGSDLWAQVNAFILKVSPFDVFLPWNASA